MRPKDFTSLEIDELISARNYLFEQKPFPLKILSEIIQKLLEKTSWVNGSDLTDDLIKLTGSKDLNDAEKALAEWKKEISEKPPEPTVPQNREELEKERVLREKQAAESKVAAKIKTEQFIKAQEKLYLNLPKKINIPEITPEDEGKLHELIVDKVRPNPTFYTDSLAKEIIKQNKTLEMSKGEVKILKANAKLVAIGHTNNLLGLESKEETIGNVAKLVWAKNPIHVAASLANPENPIVGKGVARSAQITALTLEHDNLVARNLLSKVVDPKILPFFYPGANELIIYEVSDKENKETVISVDKKAFTDQGIKLEESNNQIFNLVKGNLWGEIKNRSWGFLDKTLDYTPWYSKAKSLVPDFLKPRIPIFAAGETVQPGLSLLWSKQGIQLLSTDMPTLLSSSFGKNIFLTPSFGLQFGKFITTEGVAGQFFGVNYGNFGVNLIHYGEEKGLRLLINLRIVEGLPRVAAAEEVGTVSGKLAATAIEKGVATGAAKVGAGVVAKTAAGAAAKTGLSALFAKIGATISSIIPIPILSQILGAIVGWISGKIIEPIILWIKKHQEDLKIVGLIMLGGGMIMRSLPLMVFGGLVFVPLAIRNGLSMAGIAARTTFLFGRIGASMAITIGTPIIVTIIVFPILVAIILFIINSGAYIVPPAFRGPPGGGGEGTAAPCPGGGIEITADIAGKITGGAVQLLPDSNGARASHYCITPTMIILHSSGGYDNATGADMTFGTLVQRNLACQLATDTIKTLLMQPFYETQVEMAWCANSWDSFGVSIEISGECLGSACNPANSSCGPYDNPIFNNPPPHPCDPETDNAVSAVCAVMNQYKIPWCQIYTHDDVPDAIHTDPEGKDWVYNYFIPKIKNLCPNDQGGLCN
jgi:hypothetical protein